MLSSRRLKHNLQDEWEFMLAFSKEKIIWKNKIRLLSSMLWHHVQAFMMYTSYSEAGNIMLLMTIDKQKLSHAMPPKSQSGWIYYLPKKNEKLSSFMFINSAISELKSKADISLLHVCPPYKEIDEKMHRNRNYKIILEISKYVKAYWCGR
jgi:hypothetical protein